MSISLAAITVDCEDAAAVARFWSAALDRPLAADPVPSEDVALIGDLDDATPKAPNWLFCKVPEAKTAKNRMHVDMVAADRQAEVARLVALGAHAGRRPGGVGTRLDGPAGPRGQRVLRRLLLTSVHALAHDGEGARRRCYSARYRCSSITGRNWVRSSVPPARPR